MKLTSLKTTVGGIATLLAAVSGAVKMLADGDPATNPDWNLFVAACASGVALLFARDNNVTSEKAGAK